MPHHETLATLAISPDDYERFGLLPTRVALWEDGARTDNRSGTYEWWYFDAHLDDGSKLVVIFMNKDLATPDRPLSPILRVNLDLPNGRSYQKVVPFPARTGPRRTTGRTCGLAQTGSPAIEVESATWSAGGTLDWWVKERQQWFGRVRGPNGRQKWIKATDLRPAKDGG
jgi:hypothetical protein